MEPRLISIKKIKNHRTVRAIIEIEYCGILLRGLKLEEIKCSYSLRTAARHFRKKWEEMYEITNKNLETALLRTVIAAYENLV